MPSTNSRLWTGVVLVEQDNLPGLRQGDEVKVEIFHEEASKQNGQNFDWTSSTKLSRFYRYPKRSLNPKKSEFLSPSTNLHPYIKESHIVKLSLPDNADSSKFVSLVDSLVKCGKQSFCGYLKPDADDLRPLVCMITERGLLGFCVDFPQTDARQNDNIDSTALYDMFERTLKENLQLNGGVKCKVEQQMVINNLPNEEGKVTELMRKEERQLSGIKSEALLVEIVGKVVAKDDFLEETTEFELEGGESATAGGEKDSTKSDERIGDTYVEERLLSDVDMCDDADNIDVLSFESEDDDLQQLTAIDAAVINGDNTSSTRISPKKLQSTSCTPPYPAFCVGQVKLSSSQENVKYVRNMIAFDEKLFTKTSVKINKLSNRDIKQHLGKKPSDYKVSNDDVSVTLEEAFDNFLKYAVPVSMYNPSESLFLPSLESQLRCLSSNESCFKVKFDCDLCKKKFDCCYARRQHYLSNHAGIQNVVRKTEKNFKCSLCKTSFEDWQERHQHYVDVHAK